MENNPNTPAAPQSGAANQNESQRSRDNRWIQLEKRISKICSVRYNVVLGRVEIRRVGETSFSPITDTIENSLLRQLNRTGADANAANLRAILQSDFAVPYNPFEVYFQGLPAWDGETDYIGNLAMTVSTTNDEAWVPCFRKWIVAAVACALEPAVVNHTCIVFSGAQGLGKTTWMENLCPAKLRRYMYSGTINPGNKDTLAHLSECFLINLDELENLSRTEIGSVKEIITKGKIRIRKPYGHHSENLVRRASFMGSVNSIQFLTDTTGNRRFLCFEVTGINYKHGLDIDKVFAQAYALYRSGFRFYFNAEEIAVITQNNEAFRLQSAEEELLLTWFKPVGIENCSLYLTTSQILNELNQSAKANLKSTATVNIGKALKKHGFIRVKRRGVYVYAVEKIPFDQVEANTLCAETPQNKPLPQKDLF